MKKVIVISLFLTAMAGHAQVLVVGSVAASQTVCYTCRPVTLGATAPNGTSPTYQWQKSTDNSTFSDIEGETSITYYPPAPAYTTYYRQKQNATGVTGGPKTTNSVEIMPSGTLQEVVTLEEISTSGNQCYNARDTLKTTTFEALLHAHVFFVAGSNVLLKPGTKLDSGSYVRAYVRSLIGSVDKVTRPTVKKFNSVNINQVLKANSIKNY